MRTSTRYATSTSTTGFEPSWADDDPWVYKAVDTLKAFRTLQD
ncbi:hypothetical protein [Streptomyces sp. NPDC047042]